MEIVNVRIDSRLIHGQVAAMWTGVLKATRIMVIDNMVVKNEMMKRMLKMACPGGLKLSILNTETASENIKSKYPEDRIFVIVKQPETLLELVQFGFPLEEVTVGNINSTVVLARSEKRSALRRRMKKFFIPWQPKELN